MGGIIKSIGKTVKKLGKSVGKFLKKYRTTIILAAAVWAGLGAFGASYSAGSMFGAESVKYGFQRMVGMGQFAKGAGVATGSQFANIPSGMVQEGGQRMQQIVQIYYQL